MEVNITPNPQEREGETLMFWDIEYPDGMKQTELAPEDVGVNLTAHLVRHTRGSMTDLQ